MRPLRVADAVILIASVLAGLLVSATLSTDEDAAAQGSASSYDLFELGFTYPYSDPTTGSSDTRLAGISYVPTWAASSYPGRVDCWVVLHDSSMTEVGRLDFGLSVPEPNGERINEVPVAVSGAPHSISGGCSDPYYPPGAGYAFRLREVTRAQAITGADLEGSATVIFESSWIGDRHPGTRTCSLLVDVAGQTHEFGPYNLSIAQREYDDLDFNVPIARIKQIDSARLDCVEI